MEFVNHEKDSRNEIGTRCFSSSPGFKSYREVS